MAGQETAAVVRGTSQVGWVRRARVVEPAAPRIVEPLSQRGSSRGDLAIWSGRRGSNPRHSAWEADTLPIELLPLGSRTSYSRSRVRGGGCGRAQFCSAVSIYQPGECYVGDLVAMRPGPSQARAREGSRAVAGRHRVRESPLRRTGASAGAPRTRPLPLPRTRSIALPTVL
jgi:hypothetical protein